MKLLCNFAVCYYAMDKKKVIIVEDMDLARSGMRMAIEFYMPDFCVAGEAQTGEAFFPLLDSVGADVVLLDIGLKGMSGIDVARRLKKERPEIRILAVSADNTPETVEAMLGVGVEGFIGKMNNDNHTLVEAIRAVEQGFEYFGRDIAVIISRLFLAKKKNEKDVAGFSEQEKQVIELCHKGLSAKLIADRMGVTAKTVNWHKSNIFRKLGINSTLELVQFGMNKGIILPE